MTASWANTLLENQQNCPLQSTTLSQSCSCWSTLLILSLRMKSESFRIRFLDPFSSIYSWFWEWRFSLVAFDIVNRYVRKGKKLQNPAQADIDLKAYNSTVTQTSACLLNLSVMSLLLPVCISNILPFWLLTRDFRPLSTPRSRTWRRQMMQCCM